MQLTEAESVICNNMTSSTCLSVPYTDQMSSTNTFLPLTSTATSLSLTSTIKLSIFTKIEPPVEMMMISPSSLCFMGIYCILFIVGTVGNLFVVLFMSGEVWRKSHPSRIKVLTLHLAMADLFVILFVIPIEVFWRITVTWKGGWFLCKFCQFFRAFGLYLSSNVIICISLDRFYVIISPLKAIGGMRRVKNMLIVAWFCAIIFATPQIIVFSVESHPIFLSFAQCVNYGFFVSVSDEILYNTVSVSAMYFAPLIVILFTYVGVLIKVTLRSREHRNVRDFQQRILQQRLLLRHSMDGPPNRSSLSSSNNSNPEDLMITSRILLKRTFARRPLNPNPSNKGPPTPGVRNPSSSTGLHRRGSQFLRINSTLNHINRPRRHAFFLTMVIITAFVFLWSPYYLLLLWHMVDWESAKMVDARVQQAFFIMAVSNSCLNPIIYGNICCRRAGTNTNANGSDDQRSGQRSDHRRDVNGDPLYNTNCEAGPF